MPLHISKDLDVGGGGVEAGAAKSGDDDDDDDDDNSEFDNHDCNRFGNLFGFVCLGYEIYISNYTTQL